MDEAHQYGRPVMRPMFYEFPQEEICWDLKEQYMFGPDLLVAPVMYPGMKECRIWLPAGCSWTSLHDQRVYEGGQTISVDVPLDVIPVFIRDGRQPELIEAWQKLLAR